MVIGRITQQECNSFANVETPQRCHLSHGNGRIYRAAHQFGIVIPGVAATNWTWAVGSVSGREEDKFNCYGIPVVRGPVLGLPLVEEKCLAWMECRLLPATSAQEKYDTLFGEVVSAAADARVFVEGRWQFDDDKLNTLHHLGAGTFVTSGKRVTAG